MQGKTDFDVQKMNSASGQVRSSEVVQGEEELEFEFVLGRLAVDFAGEGIADPFEWRFGCQKAVQNGRLFSTNPVTEETSEVFGLGAAGALGEASAPQDV